VTNLEVDSRAVVPFYSKRGTAEQWIKFPGVWKHSVRKVRLEIESRGARGYITGRAKTENGNSG
jgi:hypothetical protein